MCLIINCSFLHNSEDLETRIEMRNVSSSSSIKKKKKGNENGNGSSSTTTTTTPCCSKIGLKRGPWTPEEDQVLAEFIRKEGEGRWRTLPKRAGLLRCGKSCRLRWMNYLRPSVKRGQIAPDEEDLILRLHRLLGNRWSLIAGRIPGRTDNEIKNYWNTHLSKKLISQGIDPRTHKPLIPSPLPSSSNTPPPSKPNSLCFPPIINNHQTPFISPPDVNQQFGDHFEEQYQYHDQQLAHHAVGNIVVNNDACDDGGDFNNIPVPATMDHLLVGGDDKGYSCDDVFTSFLDSLINEEDVFAAQRNLQSENLNIQPSSDDPLISSAAVVPSSYDDGVIWEPNSTIDHKE